MTLVWLGATLGLLFNLLMSAYSICSPQKANIDSLPRSHGVLSRLAHLDVTASLDGYRAIQSAHKLSYLAEGEKAEFNFILKEDKEYLFHAI